MRIIIAWVLIGSAQAIRRTVQLEEVHTISKGTADAAPSHLRSNHQRRELSFWSSFMSSVKCLTNAETRKEYNCHTHKPKAHAGGGGGGGAGSGGAGGGGGGDAANGNGSSNGNDTNGNNAGDQSNGRNGSNNGTGDGSTTFNLSYWTENGNTYTHNDSGATCTVNNGGFTCTFDENKYWNVGNGNSNGGDVNNGNNNGDKNGDSDVDVCNGSCTTYTFNNNNGGDADDGSSDDTCTYLEGTVVSCTDGSYYGFDLYNLADAAPTPSPTFQNSISNDSPEITAREGVSSISPNQLYGALTISGIAVIAALLARKRRQDVDLNDEHLLNGAVGKRQKIFGKVFSKNTLEETPGATHYVKA